MDADLASPPLRRRKPVAAEVVTPVPAPRRRKPVEALKIEEAEHIAQPHHVAGRFMVPGSHRPLPIYWQHHGAPDYVRRHAEEMIIYRDALRAGKEDRIDKLSDQMVVNIYMYVDALRRFNNVEFLTEEEFARLEYDMIGAFDNCKHGCHTDIIRIDNKDVFMKWHGGAGEVVRDASNAMVYFKLLA